VARTERDKPALDPARSAWEKRVASSALHVVRIAQSSVLALAVLCLTIALASCGFHLRGRAALPFESIYVETTGFSLLGTELRRAIRTSSKTRVAEQPDDAEVVLKIVSEQQERYVVSLSSTGKVRELELRYRLAYRLVDRASNDVVPPGEIVMRRDLTYDDTQVLAKESEEALLYQDMKSDAVQQMLRRLSLAKTTA
jgi:LPS-assembly lipoprotein